MKTKNNLLLTLFINLIFCSLSAGSIFTIPSRPKPAPKIVDISDLDKPTLLAEFYNETPLETLHMLPNQAKEAFERNHGKINVLSYKHLNIDISGDTMDTNPYNKLHGSGRAERIIANLRSELKRTK